jgi:hypothetical protein
MYTSKKIADEGLKQANGGNTKNNLEPLIKKWRWGVSPKET